MKHDKNLSWYDQFAALSKLVLLTSWLQICHDNKENRRASSDSLMDIDTDCHLYVTHNLLDL